MDKIEELLTRGVDKIYPSKEELEKVLETKKRLRVYQGFDPTGTQLHIGHMVGLRKLRQWQDLGHHVIFLIGDGTGQAGDPSGKTSTREKFLTREELRKNAADYVKQAGRIVKFKGKNPAEILFNSDWLNKLTLTDILNIAGHFSLQQLSERDLYRERAKKGRTVNLREFLYPLLQAYDSVAMNVDLELGGTDQTFNMLMGRNLVKIMQGRDKFVMTTPLLTDTFGNKIGKTEGNVIALIDKPEDLYTKIMALSDNIIVKGFEYLTDIPMDEVKQIGKDIKGGKNPISYKKILAFEIVKQLNSHESAHKAQENFEKTVQNKEQSLEILVVSSKSGSKLSEIAIKEGLVASNSEWKRLIDQGGIKKNNEQLKNTAEVLSDETILQRGRKIIRIKPK